MKKLLLMACAGVLILGLGVQDAEAKRLGGGLSKGVQRESVTQRQINPQPSAPSQQVAPHPAAPTPTPVPAGKHSWLAPLAGLAAGFGMGALLSHFGMGEGLGGLLMILLLAVAGIFIFKLFFRRSPAQDALAADHNLHYAGIGGPGMAPPPLPALQEATPPDAVARLAENVIPRNIPADFDQQGFVGAAKLNFIRLQAANDLGNLEDIREFTTPEMFAELKMDIADRQGAIQQTDVLTVDAELLEVVSAAERHVASVRFHGMIREEGSTQAFDEVWHMTKPADGSRGWVIAGIQQFN